MKFIARETVRGFSNMAYNIDGQTAQVKVIYLDVAMNAEHGGKGFRTEATQCDSPEMLKAIEHNTFPVVCDLEFEQRATKGKVALVCIGIRPVVVAKAA